MQFDREKVTKAYFGDTSLEVRLYVQNFYEYLFGEKIKLTGCSDCLRDAAIKILIKMKTNRKYILKADIPIQINGKWYVQSTLTDELAEEYLNNNPEEKIKFVKVPKKKK